ncbi:MAG TPA: pyridoxal phosphate-dependent aminotransferase [Clostridiales bacterium]|nr:pyridoxal phosphate-dependent aminotransferase [Clostridiales bacterium]
MTLLIADRTNGIYPSKIREVLEQASALKKQGVEVADFTVGRPDFDTPEHIKEAAKQALDKGFVHYTPSAGSLIFQEAVCSRYYEDYQLQFEPSQVIATVGASQAIYSALQGILNPGDEIIAPEPMYVYYGGLSFLAGAKLVSVPISDEDEFIVKAEVLGKYITPKTKAIILTSPNNPTGQVIDKETVVKISQLAIKHNLIVIADDIYDKILYDDVDYLPIAKAPGMKERTIIIGSFSKTYAMDGWRIGYLIIPKELYKGIFKLHQHMVSCPNTFVQIGAAKALTDSQKCVEDMVKEFDRRRRLIMKFFDENKISYVRPKGAFYIFPSVKEFGLDSKELCMHLLHEARVAIVPGSAFGAAGEGHIRIAFSASYEEIEQGMERMMTALNKLRNK